MEPVTILLLGGLGAYAWEKNQNPKFSLKDWLLASPASKHEALEKVKVTSVPTPSPTVALDPGMSTDQVHQVNTALLTETSPKKLLGHAEALKDLGHTSSAAALAAKASAVGEAKTKGASETEVQGKQAEAAAAAPSAPLAASSVSAAEMSACEAQTLLNAILLSRGLSEVEGVQVPVAVSGAWDAETAHLVHIFQAEHGLLATGEVDPDTAEVLRSYFSHPAAPAVTDGAGHALVGWQSQYTPQQQQQNCQNGGGVWTGSGCQYAGQAISSQPCTLEGGKIQGYRDPTTNKCVYPSLGANQPGSQPTSAPSRSPYGGMTPTPGGFGGGLRGFGGYGGRFGGYGQGMGGGGFGRFGHHGFHHRGFEHHHHPMMQPQQPMMPPPPEPEQQPMLTVTPGQVTAGEFAGYVSHFGGGLVAEYPGTAGAQYGGGGLVAEYPTGGDDLGGDLGYGDGDLGGDFGYGAFAQPEWPQPEWGGGWGHHGFGGFGHGGFGHGGFGRRR